MASRLESTHVLREALARADRPPRVWLQSSTATKSRRVVPGRLLDAGFAFAFPTWPQAARDLLAREVGAPRAGAG